MIKQVWQNLSIAVSNDKQARQVMRLLSNSKKVRDISHNGDRVYYQQLTWVQE